MAEKSTKKKPQSLNDSHYRFLQELSAPPKPTSSKPLRLYDDESENARIEAPFGDSSSSSNSEEKPVKVKINGRSSPSEEKPVKVKIKGRRRLCKLSSQVDEKISVSHDDDDEPDFFSKITDFDSPSPPPPKNRDAISSDGGNEIMDILGELSARLENLSIQKRKNGSEKEVPAEEKKLFEEIPEENLDPPEYASAGSEFSAKSADSNSEERKKPSHEHNSGEIPVADEKKVVGLEKLFVNQFVVGREEESEDDCAVVSVTKERKVGYEHSDGALGNMRSEGSFVSKIGKEKLKSETQKKKKTDVLDKYEFLKVDNKKTLVKSGKSESDDDDCIVVSNKKNSVGDSEDKNSITLRGARFTYKLKGQIAKTLYPHQREGLKWLWSLHCQGKGGILGDDMGLGKTMQICGFLAGLFSSRLIKRALIVAPKTLLPHWIKELSIVGLSDKTREYFGTCVKARQYELQYVLQDKGILLTTYDIVRANTKSLRGDNYFYDDESDDEMIWDYMILDEGHLIKNPSTQRAKSLLEIPSAHRIIISGTPIQNNLKELWALFNFCCPELFGDKKSFKERFEQPILRGNEKNASERQKRFGSEVAKDLRECIKPYFLRRLKTEVFNNDEANEGKEKLSKKSELIVWLKLTGCQRQIYEAYLKSELVLSAFDGSPLAALTILKKICDHPLLLTKRAAEDVLEEMDTMLEPDEITVANKLAMYLADAAETDDFDENQDNISCKISFISSLLGDLIPKGHNVLIFSQTRKMLNIIQDSLASNGYEYLRIDGTTKASDRLKIVNDYQSGDAPPIFMLTSQVGGLGLTLTRADRVIVVDPAWNPSTDSQSVDRAYRIGQTKDVVVYRLMTCGTVEEKIYRKQIFKGGLFRTATEQKEQTRYFSQQDLRELFSLPAQGFDVSPTQQQLHEEHDSLHIMDEQLGSHIKFLESLGIAGVSHHSLLFSKAAPVQNTDAEDEEMKRKAGPTYVGSSASSYSVERSVDGSEFAFNPKDVKPKKKKNSSPDRLTESDIKERIARISKTLGDKSIVSRLPDKGEKLEIQLVELSGELQRLKLKGKDVIDLDSINDDFQRVLNV